MASSSVGGVRRRKKPPNTSPSYAAPSTLTDAGPTAQEKRRRPANDARQEVGRDCDAASVSVDNNNYRVPPRPKGGYDEYAWFGIFLAALSYFIITRGGGNSRGGLLSSFSTPYDVVASSVSVAGRGDNEGSEELIRSAFYVAGSQRQEESLLTLATNHRLEVVISSPPDVERSRDDQCRGNSSQKSIPYLSHLSSTTWVHDEELGRGYLLLADAGRSGRIWRWEVGGGPITIGRSLHMERSGCRSGLWVDSSDNGDHGACPENLFGGSGSSEKADALCSKSSSLSSKPPLLGSASLAVELTRNAERSSMGKNLVVAEWGERRIVRVEGETGARTPLVTLVPNPGYEEDGHHTNSVEDQWRRLFRPNHLTYTPFGDLLFSDNFESDTHGEVGAIYRRKEAVHIPPIATEKSRDAHGWRGTTGEDNLGVDNMDVLFQRSGTIEGTSLGSDFSLLYVVVKSNSTKTVYKVRLSVNEEDEDDEDRAKTAEKVSVLYTTKSTDCNEHDEVPYGANDSVGSKLAVDENGLLYLIACPSSVTLVSNEDGHVIGTLTPDNFQKPDGDQRNVNSFFTSISFGEDGYLYITTPSELMRMKARVGGLHVPTNLVVPPPHRKENIDKTKT
ncbi:hypothetical protein ACHAWF_008984 [Thalassiosira exigua]